MKDVNTDALEDFMARIRQATQARSRELRMPLSEAQELAAAVGQLLARNNALLEKLVDTKEPPIEAVADGGVF